MLPHPVNNAVSRVISLAKNVVMAFSGRVLLSEAVRGIFRSSLVYEIIIDSWVLANVKHVSVVLTLASL